MIASKDVSTLTVVSEWSGVATEVRPKDPRATTSHLALIRVLSRAHSSKQAEERKNIAKSGSSSKHFDKYFLKHTVCLCLILPVFFSLLLQLIAAAVARQLPIDSNRLVIGEIEIVSVHCLKLLQPLLRCALGAINDAA